LGHCAGGCAESHGGWFVWWVGVWWESSGGCGLVCLLLYSDVVVDRVEVDVIIGGREARWNSKYT
jgi:hypothetical protein